MFVECLNNMSDVFIDILQLLHYIYIYNLSYRFHHKSNINNQTKIILMPCKQYT